MVNFRKFRTTENIIEFADAESYEKQKCDNEVDVNVASTVTLVVGKNNAGKTTIIQTLDKLVNHNDRFGVKDFNMDYLKEMAMKYQEDNFEEIPSIDFEITIGLDKGKDDYVTNIVPFLTIGGVTATEVTISVKFELTEKETFINAVKAAFSKEKKKFNALYELSNVIEDKISLFKINYYNAKGKMVERFRLNQLIEFVPILVTNIESGNALSQAFNRIVKYRYENTFSSDKQQIENELDTINDKLTQNIDASHTKDINASLDKIISGNSIQVNLCADITFKKLMENLIRYEYVEGDKYIPENQFGLGYSNLMMIIAQLIDYIEKYPESSFNSKVNLISIEEPETHMHPQMQELFIQYINDAINILLEAKDKHVNSQLVITTHSSHIVNSKIQTGGTFNNINYITERNGISAAVLLNDNVVSPDGDNAEEKFKFIKKHIKFGVSDALFSDAVIFVEGITENTILPYYIAEDQELKHRYITIVKIDGAHAYVYENLLRALGIPAAIITDLDIKRNGIEKEKFVPINSLDGRKTTNETIKYFWGTANIDNIKCPISKDNISMYFQGCYDHLYRTSFEEAFIAENTGNKIVNDVLKELKPRIYKHILGNPINYNNNSSKAYEWQRKLSDTKSEFANLILYKLLVEDKDIPVLPRYLQDALEYIKNAIRGGR
jgi:predicted ATP-dependent endonuclease of OLD family